MSRKMGRSAGASAEILRDSPSAEATESDGTSRASRHDELTLCKLNELSAEVVSLLHGQTFGSDQRRSEAEICEGFAKILLHHWELPCVFTFLRREDGVLEGNPSYLNPGLDAERVRNAATLLAADVEREGAEILVSSLQAGSQATTDPHRELLRQLSQLNLEGGAGVPIFAHGALAGVLVALSSSQEQLKSAPEGMRIVAPSIIIAIGTTRRGLAAAEQHGRIEGLVEELHRRTAALEAANRELQRVGRYRSLFLARMSHELRTPLTSILGFGEILLDQECLTDTQRRFCEKIQASGLQLQVSLNQLVDLSRIEAGQTELFLHEFSLRETLRESCATVGRLAKKHEVKLECVLSPEVGKVVSDEGKLRQVLYNFLAHAIGRSPAGATVEVRTSTAESEALSIEISDEGERLSDATHLFEPVDVDPSNENGTNMNELGLVIAHRLLTALGGSVSLHDRKPRGLAVMLILPTRPIEA